jgi:hypothetical protein
MLSPRTHSEMHWPRVLPGVLNERQSVSQHLGMQPPSAATCFRPSAANTATATPQPNRENGSRRDMPLAVTTVLPKELIEEPGASRQEEPRDGDRDAGESCHLNGCEVPMLFWPEASRP